MAWESGSTRKVFEALLKYRVGLISEEIDSVERGVSTYPRGELTVARMTHVLLCLERAQAALAAIREEEGLPPLPEEVTRA